jgi:hypothetical protein
MISDSLTHFWAPPGDEFGQVRRAPTPSSRRTATLWKFWTSERKNRTLPARYRFTYLTKGEWLIVDRHTKPEIAVLWHDTNGDVPVGLTSGAQLKQSAGLDSFGAYHLVSIGTDGFDGSSGNVAVSFVNGTQVTRSAGVGSVATAWRRTAHVVSGSWLFSDQHGGSLRQATLTATARLLRQPGDLGPLHSGSRPHEPALHYRAISRLVSA